jgi:hypothetical protein
LSSGRLILPLAEPALSSSVLAQNGATLTVYIAGGSTLATLFADSGLSTEIANPQTSNSAGRFYQQSTVIWADAANAYDCVLAFPDGESFTYENIPVQGEPIDLSAFAPINSPTFTGTPTAPTPTFGDNSSKLATTAFVESAVSGGTSGAAPINSPVFTGDPQAPTPPYGDDDTSIATTAFVVDAFTGGQALSGNGFQKLPGGLTIQWGTFLATANSSGSGSFPTPFSSSVFVCVGQVQGAGGSNSTFGIAAASLSGYTWGWPATFAGTFNASFIAIGV